MNGGSHNERCILVTGGAGYIGSHTALQLLLEGYKVVIIDNLDNSEEEAVKRVVELAGPKNGLNLYFYKVNVVTLSQCKLSAVVCWSELRPQCGCELYRRWHVVALFVST